ncbi:MAG: hypothetical protein CVU96_00015 [Firmicutes bacterium HGW-Firmicutes-20]|jgi:type IV pilus assembly protein PilA|nr:MAG: hypothetical protein CVU96_00015 [Firmicutes bacterium HGW-Firmicutes-20]PKM87478.1 MAG: hypothetical protein CVU85_05780 [Firmicutes bacterium HGW-Firmicutes-10]
MKKLLNKKGFTLIELIVVIAIIAILAAILIPALLDYINEANITRQQSNARSEYSRVVLLVATKNEAAPASGAAFDVGDDLSCTATITDGVVSDFVCESDLATFSYPDFSADRK